MNLVRCEQFLRAIHKPLDDRHEMTVADLVSGQAYGLFAVEGVGEADDLGLRVAGVKPAAGLLDVDGRSRLKIQMQSGHRSSPRIALSSGVNTHDEHIGPALLTLPARSPHLLPRPDGRDLI